MIDTTYYGTLDEADTYFSYRLNESAWTQADSTDRPKALWAATQIIDTLNYKGKKHAVSQVHEFPRGDDTEVPVPIRIATYEMAHSLLDGVDPEMELKNLGIVSHGYGSARTMYDRNLVPIENIVNGVPNAFAWRLIRPYLRDDMRLRLIRVS